MKVIVKHYEDLNNFTLQENLILKACNFNEQIKGLYKARIWAFKKPDGIVKNVFTFSHSSTGTTISNDFLIKNDKRAVMITNQQGENIRSALCPFFIQSFMNGRRGISAYAVNPYSLWFLN